MYNKKTINVSMVLMLLFMMSLFGISPCEGDSFVKPHCNLFACAIVSDTNYILAGERGKIFFSEDSGQTWEKKDSHSKSAFVSISFPDRDNGWIVGQSGTVLHSNDSGKTWTQQHSGINKYLLSVDFFDANNGCAVGADSAVIVTTDGGKTWAVSSFKVPSEFEDDPEFAEEYNLHTVKMMAADKICIAGDGGRIFISRDAGKTWLDIKSPLYDEDMMDGKIIYAMTSDAGVLYASGIDFTFIISEDMGETWKIVESKFTDQDLFSIDIIDSTGIAVGSGGDVFITHNKGGDWQVVEVPDRITRSWLTGIDLQKDSSGKITGIISGQNGVIGLFNNGIFTWK